MCTFMFGSSSNARAHGRKPCGVGGQKGTAPANDVAPNVCCVSCARCCSEQKAGGPVRKVCGAEELALGIEADVYGYGAADEGVLAMSSAGCGAAWLLAAAGGVRRER